MAAASEASFAAISQCEDDDVDPVAVGPSNVLCMISEEDEDLKSPSKSGSTPTTPSVEQPHPLSLVEEDGLPLPQLPLSNQLVLAKTESSTIFKARAEITTLV